MWASPGISINVCLWCSRWKDSNVPRQRGGWRLVTSSASTTTPTSGLWPPPFSVMPTRPPPLSAVLETGNTVSCPRRTPRASFPTSHQPASMENLQYRFRSVPQVHVQGLEAQLSAVELRPAGSTLCLLMLLEGSSTGSSTCRRRSSEGFWTAAWYLPTSSASTR